MTVEQRLKAYKEHQFKKFNDLSSSDDTASILSESEYEIHPSDIKVSENETCHEVIKHEERNDFN